MMVLITIILYILAAVIAGVVLQRASDLLRKYLPGPVGLPLVGRLPFILLKSFRCESFQEAIVEDARSHGDAAFLRVGTRKIVVLSTFDAIHEALVKQGEDFAARPKFFMENRKVDVNHGGKVSTQLGGIFFSNERLWRENRRFAVRVLREFGMGKNISEAKIQIECQGLIEELTQNVNKPFDPTLHLTKALTNIISQIVFGQRFGYDDPGFDKQAELLAKMNDSFATTGMTMPLFFPFLHNNLYAKLGFADQYNVSERQYFEYIVSKLKPIQGTFDPDEEPTNFVEAFIKEQHRLKDSGEESVAMFPEKQLIVTVADFFDAGASTGATILDWCLLYMAKYHEWQKKVQTELEQELGDRQDVAYSDRAHCPITMAVLEEIHRHVSLVPHSIDKTVAKKVTFRGCRIDPDTFIMTDLKSVHYDPKLWRDPHTFDPTRFLGENGEFKSSRHVIPFSIGKRSCAGESLAKMELFMFFVVLMRAFAVEMDEDTKKNCNAVFKGLDVTFHIPLQHRFIFKKRRND